MPLQLSAEALAALAKTLHLPENNLKLNPVSEQITDLQCDFNLAEKLHDYLCEPQEGLPVGVRRFGPPGSDAEATVITVGLHSGEIGPGSMALLPILAAELTGKLQKPVYVVSVFPETSKQFLRDVKPLMEANDTEAINKLVKNRRAEPASEAHPTFLDPNRLEKAEMQQMLENPDYIPSRPTYQRLQEILPILRKAKYFVDIHSATAPFAELSRTFPEMEEGMVDSLCNEFNLCGEPSTINTMTTITEDNANYLCNSPIRRIVSDMLPAINSLSDGKNTTLKQFVATQLQQEAPGTFTVGIEAGHHYTEKSFLTAANFVTQFAVNMGAVSSDIINTTKVPPEKGNFLIFDAPQMLRVPQEGEWRLSEFAFATLNKHGNYFVEGDVLATASDDREPLTVPKNGAVIFPPHEKTLGGDIDAVLTPGSRLGVLIQAQQHQFKSLSQFQRQAMEMANV